MTVHRNEELQEKLWEMSIRAVKGHLSPEVLEKYGLARASRGPSPHGHAQASRTATHKTEDCELLLKSGEDDDETEREDGETNAQQQTFYA